MWNAREQCGELMSWRRRAAVSLGSAAKSHWHWGAIVVEAAAAPPTALRQSPFPSGTPHELKERAQSVLL